MQSVYEVDEAGELRVVVPARCPLGDDGSGCRVGVHHHRARKTGPCFALAVARCHAHGLTFTVYPPGHVPYGRAAVLPVDPSGREARTASGTRSWAQTLFDSAGDAAADERWPLDGTEPATRRTQGRRLERAAMLLGLDLGMSERTRERLASALSVPVLELRQVPKASFFAGGSWSERGRMIERVLMQVREPKQLLVAGEIGGLWGRPSRWDPGGQSLCALF